MPMLKKMSNFKVIFRFEPQTIQVKAKTMEDAKDKAIDLYIKQSSRRPGVESIEAEKCANET